MGIILAYSPALCLLFRFFVSDFNNLEQQIAAMYYRVQQDVGAILQQNGFSCYLYFSAY